ncbi:lysosome-associated membrane glycoprotein 1 [Gastrophryne carolinensis]
MSTMETGGRGSLRVAALLMLLALLHSSSCVNFEVLDEKNNTCILADVSANFTVEYTVAEKKEKASFVLPSDAKVDGASNCGKENISGPLLVIAFGNNHSLSINFTNSVADYKVDQLVFTYNLSDKTLFPNSTAGSVMVSSKDSAISAKTNSTYHCVNPHLITMGSVNVTFHDVKIQAYINSKEFSKMETRCSEDASPTTPPPTTPPPVPTPSPSQTPETGKYSVNGTSGPCILANMGLKLHFNYTKKDQKETTFEYNIKPTNVNVTGHCSNGSAALILFSDTIYLLFNFTQNTSAGQFYLQQVSVNTTTLPDAIESTFRQDNNTLDFLKTKDSKSYKCNSEQNLQITGNFSIDTYNLQVQAFNIEENRFGPVTECVADQNGMLVPIVVGAALAGLVLIVLIAYLIGRKRSHAGYQTI